VERSREERLEATQHKKLTQDELAFEPEIDLTDAGGIERT
jgi:hypothetical protein